MQTTLFPTDTLEVVTPMKKRGKAIRSPLFYVGDKYKLMPQLKELLPNAFHAVTSLIYVVQHC